MSANGHGGSRPGAGRKPNAEKYSGQLTAAADRVAEALPRIVESLIALTLGEAAGEKWAAAGTVTRKDLARDKDGNLVVGEKGKLYVVDVPVFPDKHPSEMVLVLKDPDPPDVKAIMYAWDRLEGRPNYVVPPDPQTLDIRKALADAISLAAARKARGPAPDGPPPGPATAEGAGDDDDD